VGLFYLFIRISFDMMMHTWSQQRQYSDQDRRSRIPLY
jgi:hypothetical protein